MVTKQEFYNVGNRRFFFNNAENIAEYVRENCPAQCSHVLRVANDVVNHHFLFDLRWDMEPTAEPVQFGEEINWLYQPKDDPEWTYMLNRMRYWICLGQAYALTGDEKYPRAFTAQLQHWVATVRPTDAAAACAWRSIEVGLRLEYWLKAMQYFAQSPAINDEFMQIFADSVEEHCQFLLNNWGAFTLMSNWGVLENHGLFLAAIIMPENPNSELYKKTALQRLQKQIEMQVGADGFQWEQSPMYHNEVLHDYLDVILLARRNNIELPPVILEKTLAMCYADVYAAKPDHNELSMGDSDEIDQRDLITKGAYVFQNGVLKSRAYPQPDFDAAWDIGEAGIAAYSLIQAQLPPQTDCFMGNSGNYFYRSSWQETATYLHMRCGPLGSGHTHADQLHFDLFTRGEDILLDAGRYTYVFGPERLRYKQTAAHNVCMVDGIDCYQCTDSWAVKDIGRGINQKFYSDARYGYAEGGHLAYITQGVMVNRRLVYLKPDILLVIDEFYTGASHTYTQYLHFNNLGSLQPAEQGYVYYGRNAAAQVQYVLPNGHTKIVETRLSRKYNSWEANQTLETTFSGMGFTCAYTVFGLSAKADMPALTVQRQPTNAAFSGVAYPLAQHEALRICFGAQDFTVLVGHLEIPVPAQALPDGQLGYGSVVVLDNAADETEIGTVLQW